MLYIFTVFSVLVCCYGLEIDLTVDVAPGKMECFFQPVTKPVKLEIEYQVIDGGDLDINFFVQGPDKRVLVSQHKQTDDFHKIDIQQAGDVKVCLDNTFSHFANKVVFFEIVSDGEDSDDEDVRSWDGAQEELQEVVDMTLEDFRLMMDRIGQHLDKSGNLQTVLKMYEARDRGIMESNFSRVNMLSSIQLIVMVSVGLTQVLLIRHLFDDKSKVSGLMKSKT